MTSADIAVVQEQAALLKKKVGLNGAGIAVFTRMFEKDVDLAGKFDAILADGPPYDSSNAALRKHSFRVTSALFDMIGNAGTDNVIPLYRKYAITHKKRNVEKVHFDFVRDCLVEVLVAIEALLGQKVNQGAWNRVYDAVSQGILDSYKDV